MKKEVLKINNLKKIYHTPKCEITALEDFSFTLNEGEFVVVLGPSGAGKSTLLNLIGGMDTPTSGVIEVGDERISDYDEICADNIFWDLVTDADNYYAHECKLF